MYYTMLVIVPKFLDMREDSSTLFLPYLVFHNGVILLNHSLLPHIMLCILPEAEGSELINSVISAI